MLSTHTGPSSSEIDTYGRGESLLGRWDKRDWGIMHICRNKLIYFINYIEVMRDFVTEMLQNE